MALSSPTISEFIQALEQEIDALKKRRGGNTVRLVNGRLIREAEGLYLYHFQLENILAALDDTPGEIEIDGKSYKCLVVSVKGLDVYLALEGNFGRQIPEAVIRINLWFLLELLCKKFEDAKSSSNTLFRNSKRLFAGKSEEIDDGEPLSYELYPDPPNRSQESAITASFKKSLAVIWGPPGTGKTKTIAKAVEAHLNAGRRVLLVSHANTAVDEALEKIAHQLKQTAFYLEGKLIRLGIPYKATLEENYPLVTLENIATMLGKSLIEEKFALEVEREEVKTFLNGCREISLKQSKIDSQRNRKAELDRSVQEKYNQERELDHSINSLAKLIEYKNNRLKSAREAGAIKRFLLGLDLDKIHQEIEEHTASLSSLKQEKSKLEQSCKQVESAAKDIENRLITLMARLTALFDKHGYDPETFESEKENHEIHLDELNSKIVDIDKTLNEVQGKALANARFIATTLTKTFSAKDFPDEPFDVLVVDESSMAPLPYLYWAASKTNKFITVVGDFQQLPPICISKKAVAQKWLGKSIFDVLSIVDVDDASLDARVSFLDVQYRMYPDIAGVANRLFYDNKLHNAESTRELVLNDALTGKHALVLVNTEDANPWGSQLTPGRFNLYHALVVATLSRELLELYADSEKVERIGVITPYSAQARLIGKIAGDMGIRESLRVNTVHTFQGGEEPIIILDTVESFGNKRWSMLDDVKSKGSNAKLLANVAITRPRYKLLVVGNKQYLHDSYSQDSVICQIVDIIAQGGHVVQSGEIDDSFQVDDFEKWATALEEPTVFMENLGSSIYSEKNFWPAFTADLLSTQNSVMIMSPFLTPERTGKLQNCFRVLLNKGVEIRVFTRPASEQGGILKERAGQVIHYLEETGVKVFQLTKMHQKIAVTDRKITWEGSLNILSHSSSGEHMRRIEGPGTAEQIIKNYQLDKDFLPNMQLKELCPECAKKGVEAYLVVKHGRYGSFLACPKYPRCKYTRSLNKGGPRI